MSRNVDEMNTRTVFQPSAIVCLQASGYCCRAERQAPGNRLPVGRDRRCVQPQSHVAVRAANFLFRERSARGRTRSGTPRSHTRSGRPMSMPLQSEAGSRRSRTAGTGRGPGHRSRQGGRCPGATRCQTTRPPVPARTRALKPRQIPDGEPLTRSGKRDHAPIRRERKRLRARKPHLTAQMDVPQTQVARIARDGKRAVRREPARADGIDEPFRLAGQLLAGRRPEEARLMGVAAAGGKEQLPVGRHGARRTGGRNLQNGAPLAASSICRPTQKPRSQTSLLPSGENCSGFLRAGFRRPPPGSAGPATSCRRTGCPCRPPKPAGSRLAQRPLSHVPGPRPPSRRSVRPRGTGA